MAMATQSQIDEAKARIGLEVDEVGIAKPLSKGGGLLYWLAFTKQTLSAGFWWVANEPVIEEDRFDSI